MDDGMPLVFAIGLGLGFGAIFGMVAEEANWRSVTVDRGLAIYCPQDGQWAWIGECKAEGRKDE